MPPDAFVSVVIPVHNGERFLAAAIDSALVQDHTPVEVVVVDDGSTDASAAVARSHAVHYVWQENAGEAAARNAGVAASSGDLIAFLDQDDEWLPEKLSTQVAYLHAHPEVDLLLCHGQNFLEPGTPAPAWGKAEWLKAPRPCFLPSAWMLRRSTFEENGGFDTSYEFGSDTAFVARANDSGLMTHMLPDCLFRHRIHGANRTHDVSKSHEGILRALRETVARKRAEMEVGDAL